MASQMTNIPALKDLHGLLSTRMNKSVEDFRNNLMSVRTGRASVHMLDPVRVDAYGSEMPLNQVAQISTPESQLITVSPFDRGLMGAIEKAIQKSNLGLTASIQGKAIRIFFPELSQERRQEFVKIIRKMAEDGRVAIRHVRRDAMEQLKKHGHDSGTTEDDLKHAEKELQKLTDDYIGKIDSHLAGKEKEIMTV